MISDYIISRFIVIVNMFLIFLIIKLYKNCPSADRQTDLVFLSLVFYLLVFNCGIKTVYGKTAWRKTVLRFCTYGKSIAGKPF